jgi:hypothetical protein
LGRQPQTTLPLPCFPLPLGTAGIMLDEERTAHLFALPTTSSIVGGLVVLGPTQACLYKPYSRSRSVSLRKPAGAWFTASCAVVKAGDEGDDTGWPTVTDGARRRRSSSVCAANARVAAEKSAYSIITVLVKPPPVLTRGLVLTLSGPTTTSRLCPSPLQALSIDWGVTFRSPHSKSTGPLRSALASKERVQHGGCLYLTARCPGLPGETGAGARAARRRCLSP